MEAPGGGLGASLKISAAAPGLETHARTFYAVAEAMATNPFTDHPHEVGETYFQHMRIAAKVGFAMAIGAAACFVHAIFPFLCVRTGSSTISRLYRRIHQRVEGPDWERHPII